MSRFLDDLSDDERNGHKTEIHAVGGDLSGGWPGGRLLSAAVRRLARTSADSLLKTTAHDVVVTKASSQGGPVMATYDTGCSHFAYFEHEQMQTLVQVAEVIGDALAIEERVKACVKGN